MSEWQDFQEGIDAADSQIEEVQWMLRHANTPIPMTSLDMNDAANTAREIEDKLDIDLPKGFPQHPYVGDFKQPKE